MMDDDDSTCSGSAMSPSMDGNNVTTSTQVSPDDRTCGVKVPDDNDVLCGRGGSINSHPGNERFRTLVEKRKRVYLTARFKREKRLIASSIVSEIHAIHGRFLQRDPKSGLWKDIGDEKARDKTSQALRENAPSIRAEIEDEINELHHHHSNSYTDGDSSLPPPSSSSQHHYPHATPSSSSQQQQYGWYHPSYYGYPPPQPTHHHPVHPHMHSSSSTHPYPPPPHHHHTGYSLHPPPPTTTSNYQDHQNLNYNNGSSATYHNLSSSIPSRPKTKRSTNGNSSSSVIDLTADLVTSSAEAIKSWTTKATSSFTGGGDSSSQSHHHRNRHHAHDNMTVATGTISNPISYKHNGSIGSNNDDVHHRRKMVKFRDDHNHHHHNRRQEQNSVGPNTSTNSILQQQGTYDDNDEDLEPQSVDVATNASLMSQVANHILGSFDTWQMDGTASICGGGGSTSLFPMFYDNDSKAPNMPQAPPSEYVLHDIDDEEMNCEVAWEGQEVQLVDDRLNNDDKQRMPPPSPVSVNHLRRGSGGNSHHSYGQDNHVMGTASTAFSSLGSCHSWLPEQMAAASSYFSGRTDPEDGIVDDSMMMMHHGDYNSTGVANGSIAHSTAENYSMAGESIGGASLTKVFDNNTHFDVNHHQQHNHRTIMQSQQNMLSSPPFSQRELHQMPSWERSLRSRSPSSFNDDESLVSKTDSKGAFSSVHSMNGSNADDMAWTHTRIE